MLPDTSRTGTLDAGGHTLPRQGTRAGRTEAQGSDVLAIGFATAVAMWGVGYAARLPGVGAPAALVFAGLVLCALAGGYTAGRFTERGWKGGAAAGLVTGLVNLLVLGGLASGDAPARLVVLFLPGSILASAALGAAGGMIGVRSPQASGGRGRGALEWTSTFGWVACAATLLLLIAGGLVTSHGAGLAVVDWPNSFGYAMFLYPLSRMTGGIYYEHAHRLFGSLVGLTTLVLAIQVWRTESRRAVRWLGVVALVMVIVQGMLGGLRVTGRFTLGSETEPNLALAAVHGVFAQAFFGTLVVLAVVTSRRFRALADARRVSPAAESASHRLGATTWQGIVLLALLLLQIAIGALQRHFASGLMVHIAMAALVAPLAIHFGFKCWGTNPGHPVLGRGGLALAAVTAMQVMLGIGAAVATGAFGGDQASPWSAIVATAHQVGGAVTLATAVFLTVWSTVDTATSGTGPALTSASNPR